MAITAYTGVMGSGKSYEVVEFVIVPQFAAGRRIVTNLPIQIDVLKKYCVEKLKADPDKLGEIVFFTLAELKSPDFFCRLERGADGLDVVVNGTFVTPGTLFVFDEAAHLWGAKEKIETFAFRWLTTQRHFVDLERGHVSDAVVIAQSIKMLNRDLVEIIELLFVAKKTSKNFGGMFAKNPFYNVTQYDGNKVSRESRVKDYKRFYKKEIFPLYRSYMGGGGAAGTELVTDKRQNRFTVGLFVVLPIVILVVCGFSVRYCYKFFYPDKVLLPGAGEYAVTSGPGALGAPGRPGVAAVAPVIPPPPREFSDEWRLAGYLSLSLTRRVVVIVSSEGRSREISATDCVWVDALPDSCKLDDKGKITTFSGKLYGSDSNKNGINAPLPPPPAPAPVPPGPLSGVPGRVAAGVGG